MSTIPSAYSPWICRHVDVKRIRSDYRCQIFTLLAFPWFISSYRQIFFGQLLQLCCLLWMIIFLYFPFSLACLQSDDWNGMDYGGCGLFACTIEVLWSITVLGPSFYVVPASCSGSIEVHFIWARTFLVSLCWFGHFTLVNSLAF